MDDKWYNFVWISTCTCKNAKFKTELASLYIILSIMVKGYPLMQ